jgi:hypothetical protein
MTPPHDCLNTGGASPEPSKEEGCEHAKLAMRTLGLQEDRRSGGERLSNQLLAGTGPCGCCGWISA